MPRTTTPTKLWEGAEIWKVSKLKPYDKNTRTHPPDQVKLLARLLQKYGPDQPIVVDENGVILKGHGRRLAAMEAQIAEFPVFIKRGLSENEKRELRISDNQVALLSGWDEALMREEIGLLKVAEMDLSMMGFTDSQLAKFLDSTPGRTEPDAAPDLPKVAIIKPGEIWTLGRHRLMCGDATKPADVARLADGDRCQMTFCDPPYGVAYRDSHEKTQPKGTSRKRWGNKPKFDAIENDDLDEKQLLEFLISYMRLQPLAKDAAQYICHANLRQHVFREAILANQMAIRAVCIWAKSKASFNFANYKWKHEPIFYAVPAKGKVAWYGDKSQYTLWDIPSESGAAYKHPTQKPVALAAIAIKNSSKAGDYIYEPFAGSGSTLIACEMSGRSCIAMELSAAYVQVVIERWQSFTGLVATLGEKSYASVLAERQREKPAKTKKGKDVLVYRITNQITGKQYVGLTKHPTLARRWSAHLTAAKNGTPTPLYRAIRKYGQANFSIEAVACARNYEDLKRAEIEVIRQDRTHVSFGGYNVTFGGDGTVGWVPSADTRDKIRKATKATMADPARRAHLSECGTRQFSTPESRAEHAKHNTGRIHTAETRRKVSEAGKRRPPRSEETRAKLAAALRGRPRPPEVRAKVSASKLGKPMSAEARLNMSRAARRGVPLSEAHKAAMRAAWVKRREKMQCAVLSSNPLLPGLLDGV